MGASTNQNVLAWHIYKRVLSNWPKQDLRPDYQFQDIFKKTIEARFECPERARRKEELLKARALEYLLNNKYQERYKLVGPMLQPKSQPTYFEDLVREIEEAPNRSWFGRIYKRLSGLVRLQ